MLSEGNGAQLRKVNSERSANVECKNYYCAMMPQPMIVPVDVNSGRLGRYLKNIFIGNSSARVG